MYEIPKGRAVRRAVTREEVEAEQAEAELTEWLIDAIETNPDVQAAIRRLMTGAPRRQQRPTTTQPVRRGGRR